MLFAFIRDPSLEKGYVILKPARHLHTPAWENRDRRRVGRSLSVSPTGLDVTSLIRA